MNYKTIYTDFKKLFPEEKEKFSRLEEENAINEDGDELAYVSFGIIIMPYIYELLKNKDDAKLKLAFSFFEEMAKDTDENIQGILQFTVLENLVTEDKSIYKAAQKYIGPETKSFVNQIANYMSIKPMK